MNNSSEKHCITGVISANESPNESSANFPGDKNPSKSIVSRNFRLSKVANQSIGANVATDMHTRNRKGSGSTRKLKYSSPITPIGIQMTPIKRANHKTIIAGQPYLLTLSLISTEHLLIILIGTF